MNARDVSYQTRGSALHIADSVFEKLMKKSVCDTGEDLDAIGFTAEAFGYSLNFYAELESDHDLQIDCFGRETKDGWVDYEPTPQQRLIMYSIVKQKAASILADIDVQDENFDMNDMWPVRPQTIYPKEY